MCRRQGVSRGAGARARGRVSEARGQALVVRLNRDVQCRRELAGELPGALGLAPLRPVEGDGQTNDNAFGPVLARGRGHRHGIRRLGNSERPSQSSAGIADRDSGTRLPVVNRKHDHGS